MNKPTQTLTVNGREVAIGNERNLLEVVRKAGIEIPTFCYHSELSIYGACRLCLVEIKGRGILASCSTAPEPGMVVRTDTAEIRNMRKITVELLLASHKRECPSCSRSANCSLQDIARKLGVTDVRYKQVVKHLPIDASSPSLVRDPAKCVLCGDCVRVCSEVQTVGALDFAGRGANARVAPAFGLNLGDVECVNCGQCAAVCPTGAIVPKNDGEKVWAALHDPKKTVVVQVAPAVRVALGDHFGFPTGENVAPKLVAALRVMGFDQVYDTCYAADMTIFEEATELIGRIGEKGVMPMFTSCCPGWVKFIETFYPEMLPHVSSTRSPQQIFGAVMRKVLPEQLNLPPEDLVVVSIMPCTAKKFEAQMPKFKRAGRPDVDFVLTTIELTQMIESMGINLRSLDAEAFDMPFGFATGGGLIFGATGGVMEAALRFAAEKLGGKPLAKMDFRDVRGLAPRKEAEVELGGRKLRLAVVHGLGNARKLLEELKAGKLEVDFVEVMACPGGCVSGGGQPINREADFRGKRAKGLYDTDQAQQLQNPQDNYWVEKCYQQALGGHPGSHEAHQRLHTRYQRRNQIFDARIPVLPGEGANPLPIVVAIHTRSGDGAERQLLGRIVQFLRENGLDRKVRLDATFRNSPTGVGKLALAVGEIDIRHDESPDQTYANAVKAIESELNRA
jgi:NADH-quinone oxidoreductase subunit G